MRLPLSLLLIALPIVIVGCKKATTGDLVVGPDYTRQLPYGAHALRKITDPSKLPDLAGAYANADEFLLQGLDRSAKWFEAPSGKQFFPVEDVSHEHAHSSVLAMRELVQRDLPPDAFVSELTRLFDVYESVGYNNEGVVLFTGYYAPIFDASREQTPEYAYPLYKRPADLVTDPVTGEPKGRKLPDGSTAPYPTRKEIEDSEMFAGSELVWLADPLSAYIIHVNGSAKLRLTDGSLMYVGYGGKTDRPYKGLGQSIMEEGLIPASQLSLPAIKRLYRQQPDKVQELIYRNESYVFFKEYAGASWPAGSLGVRVTPETTLATDKKIYPRGGVVLVSTKSVNFSFEKRDFLRFMLDQDTGGAIRAPGRADIYMGDGPSAEILAGGQYAEGRLYYFFLKPEYIVQFAPKKAGKTAVTSAGSPE